MHIVKAKLESTIYNAAEQRSLSWDGIVLCTNTHLQAYGYTHMWKERGSVYVVYTGHWRFYNKHVAAVILWHNS